MGMLGVAGVVGVVGVVGAVGDVGVVGLLADGGGSVCLGPPGTRGCAEREKETATLWGSCDALPRLTSLVPCTVLPSSSTHYSCINYSCIMSSIDRIIQYITVQSK